MESLRALCLAMAAELATNARYADISASASGYSCGRNASFHARHATSLPAVDMSTLMDDEDDEDAGTLVTIITRAATTHFPRGWIHPSMMMVVAEVVPL